jgi:putative Flp pilus-assembly TadE/G-like protein
MLSLKHLRRGTSMTIKKNRQRGQVLIMTTLLLIPMLGMLGMVTDLGYMRYVKMTAQTAAEAAAWSAIVDFHSTVDGAVYTCGTNDVVCTTSQQTCDPSNTTSSIRDGCKYGEAHGFTDDKLTFEAGASSTPPTAPGIGTAAYWVTFRAYKTVPQLFSAVLGNYSGLVVGRSTAALVVSADCIYALDPSKVSSISVAGTANLTSSCGIYDDSSANCAMSTNGGAQISAPNYDIVGTACTNPLTPAPNLGVTTQSDPLASLPAPTYHYPPCQNYSNSNNGSTINLSPGVYCGGIQVKNNTVNFAPGTYVLLGGGLSTQDSNSIINGSNGVTFYNTFDPSSNNPAYNAYQPININASSSVDLTAPTTGDYAGMLFFDDRNAPTGNNCGNGGNTSCADNYGGGSTAIYQGIIYNKNNCITMYGNSSVTTQYSMIVADCISLVGTTTFNNNYSSLPHGQSPIQYIAVVE